MTPDTTATGDTVMTADITQDASHAHNAAAATTPIDRNAP
jgi:hypothetical protein